MSVYNNTEMHQIADEVLAELRTMMHQIADAVLAELRTIPAQHKFSEEDRNWASFEAIQKHIHANRKQTGLHLDTETLLTMLGILSGRNQIEISRAHGLGVGYFYIFRPTPEDT